MADLLKRIICGRNNVGLSTVSHIESLHCLREVISRHFPFPNIEHPHTSIHTRTEYLRTVHLHLRDGVLEAFDDFDGMIGIVAIVPAPHSRIVRGANLEYSGKYNHIVLLIEADAVDPRSMPRILTDVLPLHHVGEDDVLIAPSRDELGVVLADVEGVDVVVMDVAVVLDEQVPRRVVQAHPSVL